MSIMPTPPPHPPTHKCRSACTYTPLSLPIAPSSIAPSTPACCTVSSSSLSARLPAPAPLARALPDACRVQKSGKNVNVLLFACACQHLHPWHAHCQKPAVCERMENVNADLSFLLVCLPAPWPLARALPEACSVQKNGKNVNAHLTICLCACQHLHPWPGHCQKPETECRKC